jgi:hypothetical protein
MAYLRGVNCLPEWGCDIGGARMGFGAGESAKFGGMLLKHLGPYRFVEKRIGGCWWHLS